MSIYDLSEIEPSQLYPASFCCRVIPSSRAGKSLNLRTWHRWREEGLFVGVKVGAYWFMRGEELLRLVHYQRPPAQDAPTPRSAARAARALEQAQAAIRELCKPRRPPGKAGRKGVAQ